MICRNCGNTVDVGIVFCPYCGKKIEDLIDLEKKTAAVNDVFDRTAAAAQPAAPATPMNPVPAFNDVTRPNVPPVSPVTPPPAFSDATRPNVPPVSPVTPPPAFSDATRPNVPPVPPPPAFSDATRPNVPPVSPVTPPPAFSDAPKQAAAPSAAVRTPVQPAKAAQPKKKEFFGAGAFALCLAVIGLLAASTGIFAYLYFSLLGVL